MGCRGPPPTGCGCGTSCPGEGYLWLGTRPPPTACPSGVRPELSALVPLARGCGCEGPLATPQRTLLRAGVARCGRGRKLPRGGGGAPVAQVREVCGHALALSLTPLRRAWSRAHCPCSLGAGVWVWGPVTDPTAHPLASWRCALWEWHEGVRGGGGGSCLVRGAWVEALTHPRLLVLRVRGRGPCDEIGDKWLLLGHANGLPSFGCNKCAARTARACMR